MSLRKAFSLLAAVVAFAAGAAWSQAPVYSLLSPQQPTDGSGKIEVIEFFWYGCPHCYALEPSVNAWLKTAPKDVVFKRVPAIPSESWASTASIYYTLEAMGLLDKYHDKVFDAIHKQQVNLANKTKRDEWLKANGIDPAKYAEVEKSFSVASKVARARQLTQAYKVDSVPRIVVNGKYVTSAEQVGGADKVFPAVDQIIALARKDKS
ncbi:MAG: thiol:disulfide interchange protein DsbA/DsbL [Usitatibacter sp.]